MSDEAYDEPRTLNPFKIITPGEDTVDGDENIVFSDFRPVILDADTPEPVDYSPKAESAPEPVLLQGSELTIEHPTSASPAPTPASSESGTSSPDEISKLSSSSDTKTGLVVPPAPAKPPTSEKTPKPETPGSPAKDTPLT